ncbi:MAG: hypothetical protein ACK5CF_07275 [Opitutaceae bacterium]
MLVDSKLLPNMFLPPTLQDLLLREAVFQVSRRRLEEALAVARDELTGIQAERPRLGFVRQEARRAHQLRIEEAEEGVILLQTALEKLGETMPQLIACVGRSVENYLREMDPEYVTGLSAARFVDDWDALLARYSSAVERYLGSLNRLPALLEAFPQGESCGSHPEGRRVVEETMQAAALIQEEIAFLNRIADAQSLRRGKPPTLQRQPERNWRRLAFGILDLPPLEALKIVRGLSSEAEEQLPRVFSAIKAECRLANFSGNYGVSSYREKMWQGFRTAAAEKIQPDRFEQIVSETEIMLETGRLHEWKADRVEIQASPEVVAAELAPLLAATPAPKPAAAATASAAGATTVAAAASAKRSANGRIVYRPSGGASATAVAATAAAAAVNPDPAAAGLSVKDLAAMAELQAERERLELLLRETRASLSEREAFLSQSEAKLMATTQAQIEREVELEQREEELRELERRYREFQLGGLGAGAASMDEAEVSSAKVPMDEFKD